MFGNPHSDLHQLFQDSGTEVPDFFTVLLLAICRLIACVHVPGLNTDALKAFF